MAKRRRDRAMPFDIANPPLRSLAAKILQKTTQAYSGLKALEDRRLFSPELFRPAKAFTRSATRIIPHAQKPRAKNSRFRAATLTAPANLRFADPRSVAICVRRNTRREVLHALKRTGRGSSRRIGKWSEFSHIHCKR